MSIIFPKDVLKIISDKLADSDRIKHLEEVIYQLIDMSDFDYIKCAVKRCYAYVITISGRHPNYYYNCTNVRHCPNGHALCDKHMIITDRIICPLCPSYKN